MMDKIEKLIIQHNHGQLILGDVSLVPYEESETIGYQKRTYKGFDAIGTILGGGETSRLFHATSTTKYPVGQQKTYRLWGRTPSANGDGSWFVDCSFCG